MTTEGTETAECPQCEGAVETIRQADVFRYGDGESAVDFPVVLPVRHCRGCGFEFLDQEAERTKYEALCRHFGVLTPWEIRAIRERYDLSLEGFAKLTGLDTATLGRWETGTLIQPTGDDRYLRLLAEANCLDTLKAVARLRSAGTDSIACRRFQGRR